MDYYPHSLTTKGADMPKKKAAKDSDKDAPQETVPREPSRPVALWLPVKMIDKLDQRAHKEWTSRSVVVKEIIEKALS